MANEQNLIKPSPKEARENGRKGGIASGVARQQKKATNQRIVDLINKQLTDKEIKSLSKATKVAIDEGANYFEAMAAGQIASALKGNTKAFSALIEISKEVEEKEERKAAEELARLNRTYHMDLDMLPDNFHKTIRDIRNEKHQEYVFEGGRGSTKSSDVAQIIVELIKNNHDIHAAVCRKVGNTLKDSVYSKIKWAIEKQGLTDEFEYRKSPLEIIYKPTKQKIYFRGADEPEKIKSISPEFGYIAILWFEELDQFNGEEEIRNITQSAIRGGEKAWVFKSFNPPKSLNNWANKYVRVPKDNMVVHHSDYTEVPEEWLGQPFIDEAEHLKDINPSAYEHEYLGIPNGNGGLVFEYVEVRRITDEEIERFDNIKQGEDFGWYPDQYAFLRTAYEPAQEKIYLLDELYVNKWSNEKTGQWIIDKEYDDYDIIADSAEPKSIQDHRDMALPVRGAKKGPGSIEYGFKWLQRRTIVIDPERTPNAYKEITEYEYERDKDGNVISGYPDGNDHAISALRYAYEPTFNRRENKA